MDVQVSKGQIVAHPISAQIFRAVARVTTRRSQDLQNHSQGRREETCRDHEGDIY